MKAVFPKRNALAPMPDDGQVLVTVGEHWADNDPVVLQHPDLFSDDPRYGLAGAVPTDDEVVEVASAAPGERRSIPGPRPGQGTRRG